MFNWASFSKSWTTAIAAAAAASVSSFLFMDANPSLYLYDRFVCTDRHLRRRLFGKRVWITGASSGIGAQIAMQLSDHGANVVLSGRNENALSDVANECRQISRARLSTVDSSRDGEQHGGSGAIRSNLAARVATLPFDVTEKDDEVLEKIVDAAIENLGGGIDILILNAGRSQLSPATKTPSVATRELMELNMIAPVRLALKVLEKDRWSTRNDKRKGVGHIVVTSSVAAKMAVPLSSSYAASKHAVNGYFNSLRTENPNLRVDLPCPGPVDTAIGRNAFTVLKQDLNDHGKNGIKNLEEGGTRNKMSAERCARLIVSGMVGPASLFHDTWIQNQPLLSFSYLHQFTPSLANLFLRKIGKIRLTMWEHDLPLYEGSSWRKAAALSSQ